MKALVSALLFLACCGSAQAMTQEQLFEMKAPQVVELLLDQGGILIGERPTKLERQHIGRRLICKSNDNRRMSVPEVSSKMFSTESVTVRCADGVVFYSH